MKQYIALTLLLFSTFHSNALEVNLVWKDNIQKEHIKALTDFSNQNDIPFKVHENIKFDNTTLSVVNFDNEKRELDNDTLIDMLYKTKLFADVFYLN